MAKGFRNIIPMLVILDEATTCGGFQFKSGVPSKNVRVRNGGKKSHTLSNKEYKRRMKNRKN